MLYIATVIYLEKNKTTLTQNTTNRIHVATVPNYKRITLKLKFVFKI